MTGVGDWAVAFNKASALVANMTLDEKVWKRQIHHAYRILITSAIGQPDHRSLKEQWLFWKYPRDQATWLSRDVPERRRQRASRDRFCQLFPQWNPCRC